MVTKENLDAVPAKPGVYLMLDGNGKIIYVGKAASLRSRVRSYFQPSAVLSPRVSRMVEQVKRVDFITTASEVEALALECNLIKEHRPKYNIRLRDDKQYPWIKVTVQETFPRVYIVRSPQKDGARYFGPYTNTGVLREIFGLIRKLFTIRICKKKLTGTEQDRPCLNYHIGRCSAPCGGKVSPEEYRAMIQELLDFLEGKTENIARALTQRMNEAAKKQDYEKAIVYRDKLRALEQMRERQTVVSAKAEDRDVLGWARGPGGMVVQVWQIRQGRLIGKKDFFFPTAVAGEAEEKEEMLRGFLLQYYDEQDLIPREILLPFVPREHETLQDWLREKSKHAVYLLQPKRGEKYQLLKMARENAGTRLQQETERYQRRKEQEERVLERLKDLLALPGKPCRIEAFDVSNLRGNEAVTAMVVFENGRPRKDAYRRFRIRGVTGINDPAMLGEAVRRRFLRGLKERQQGEEGKGFAVFPDLLLIDGGTGQLQAVCEVLAELGLEGQPVASLAEANEEIFLPGRREPLRLPPEDEALRLLQHARDEAHRYAVTYHRLLRDKKMTGSALDRIKGIGPKRKKALLARFGSVQRIKEAGLEELMSVKGITEDLARTIREELT